MNGRGCVYDVGWHHAYRLNVVRQLTSSIKENPRLRAAAEELRKGGLKVSDAVSEAIKSMEESEWMRSVSTVVNYLRPTKCFARSPKLLPPCPSV